MLAGLCLSETRATAPNLPYGGDTAIAFGDVIELEHDLTLM
jgi:hypothetical protein